LQNEETLVRINIKEDKSKYMQIKRKGIKNIRRLKLIILPLIMWKILICSILNADNKINIEFAERITKDNKAYYSK
jgi:hypothetical protein